MLKFNVTNSHINSAVSAFEYIYVVRFDEEKKVNPQKHFVPPWMRVNKLRKFGFNVEAFYPSNSFPDNPTFHHVWSILVTHIQIKKVLF